MSLKKLLVLPVAIAFLGIGFGTANAQVVTPTPSLAIGLETSGLTNPLTVGQNATLARLTLDTTGSNTAVRISSLPFDLTTGSGATATSLTNCQVFNESNGGAITSGSNVPSTLTSGMNTVTLDNPLVLPAGTVTTLALRCNIGSNLVTGGTYQFSMNTANVVASDPVTGTPAVVTLRGVAPVVVPVVPVTPVVVPTVPNTGAGGEASANLAIIFGSLVAAGIGLAYARRATR
jgi:hypothetical protein